MNTDQQPDLLGATPAKPKKAKKAAPPAKATKPKKKAGTAVAVDDPKKRQQVAAKKGGESASNLLSTILEAFRDPAVGPEKSKAAFDFYKEVQAHQAKSEFDDAFVALQAELPSIRRDGKIEVRKKDAAGERTGALQQSTPYATFNAIHEAIKPLLVKYGFGLSFSTAPTADGRLIVKTTLSRKGHSISTEFPLPAETSGSKNNVQGWGSSQSYGKRYGTIALLNIVSHDPRDADTDGHEGKFVRAKDGLAESVETATISEAQLAELNAKMIACKVPLAVVLKHYAIAKLEELPAAIFASALKNCETYTPPKKDDTFPADRVSTGGQGGAYRR